MSLMSCSACGYSHTNVVYSRPDNDGKAIRRRRECPKCGFRFTTMERRAHHAYENIMSGGKRENFDRDALETQIRLAVMKGLL